MSSENAIEGRNGSSRGGSGNAFTRGCSGADGGDDGPIRVVLAPAVRRQSALMRKIDFRFSIVDEGLRRRPLGSEASRGDA